MPHLGLHLNKYVPYFGYNEESKMEVVKSSVGEAVGNRGEVTLEGVVHAGKNIYAAAYDVIKSDHMDQFTQKTVDSINPRVNLNTHLDCLAKINCPY